MARKKLIKGWEWVRTERVGTAERKPEPITFEETAAVEPRPSAAGGLAPLAVTSGLLVGAVLLMRNRRKKQQPERNAAIAELPPSPPPQPKLVLFFPETAEELQRLSDRALAWMRVAPNEPDERLAPAIWYAIWPRVEYPGSPREGDHPSIQRAHVLIRLVLAGARAKRAAELALEDTPRSAAAEPAPAPEPEPEPAPAPEPAPSEPAPESELEPEQEEDDEDADAEEPQNIRNLLSEQAIPGRLYRVHPQIAPYGLEAIAALALRYVGNVQGMAAGMSAEDADARACELADDADIRGAYVELIEASWWNKPRLDPVKPKSFIWCPPLSLDALFDEQPRVELDPRPWSNGATRNDPPPPHWQPHWRPSERMVS